MDAFLTLNSIPATVAERDRTHLFDQEVPGLNRTVLIFSFLNKLFITRSLLVNVNKSRTCSISVFKAELSALGLQVVAFKGRVTIAH
jgi:hypothetical protein